MEKQDIITLEAIGEFPFTFFIEKAVATEIEKDLIIEGIASTTNVDHDKERMSKDALHAMEAAINKEGVPLRVEHHKEDSAIIGRVYKAWVDERNQLHVRARLDKAHPVSPILHHSMKSGTKMGLSVGGVVKRAMKEFVESVGGMVKTFYDVALNEVSVTPRPANYDSWLVAKSIADDVKDAEKYADNEVLRREFLFENSQLDYLQAFAKSVPDKAWRKVDPLNIKKDSNNMKDIKKDEDKDDETSKSVSRQEFISLSKSFEKLSSLVSKGFENIGLILTKAMDGDAKDSTNPSKDKPEDESPTAKDMGDSPKEQVNPDQTKEKDETQQTAKTEDDKDETTKADETDETTKGEETYDMETVERSIKVLDGLHKKLKGIKKAEDTDETTKTEDDKDETTKTDDTDETKSVTDEETKSATDEETTKAHPLDVFVVKLTQMMETVVDKMEKSGKRIMGFEKAFIDDIRNSPEIQAEIQKMIKQPGLKKSVSKGVPYMATKDGRMIPLTVVPEKVEKSDDKPKNFRELYKSEYSSVNNAE